MDIVDSSYSKYSQKYNKLILILPKMEQIYQGLFLLIFIEMEFKIPLHKQLFGNRPIISIIKLKISASLLLARANPIPFRKLL